MSIHYALYENHLTADPSDFYARPVLLDSVGLKDIVEEITRQGSTTTRSDIHAVLEDALTAIESLMLKGFRVNFGDVVQLFPRIKGKFQDLADSFDPSRHQLDAGASPGTRIRNTLRNQGEMVKEETLTVAPNVVQYKDTQSQTSGILVSPGNIGELIGFRLKHDTRAADEGVFFVPVEGGPEVKAKDIQTNQPKQLVFLNPDLDPGSYLIEVRSRLNGTDDLRVGRLNTSVTVESRSDSAGESIGKVA